ncbi:MAG: substrate-binding domain-containing protein [Solirubrobacteraceae bacterium]|nr:substrate-binding domain-containing protein [Solirubrobacteraceae bacterium]
MKFQGSRRTIGLLAVVAALGLTACGSDDDEPTATTGNDGAVTTTAGAGSADAEAAVADALKTTGIEFPQPDEAFDPGTGKVAVISCGQAGLNCKLGSDDVREAAKAMGWTASPVFDGEFAPAKQAGYVQQAIREGYDAIVLVSIDANSIKAALDAAKAKDIPVACVMCTNAGFDGVVDVTTNGVTDGEAIANWIAADSGGKAKILAYDDKSFPIVAERLKAMKARLAEVCAECSIDDATIPTTDLQKPGPPTWTAALAKYPQGAVDYVMSPYDPFAIPFSKTAEQRGRTDLKIGGYDASPDFVAMIKKGDGPAAVTTAAPFPYASWGAMDQVARIKAGKEPWKSDGLPVALVTKENADAFDEAYLSPEDFDFKSLFAGLWGKD